MVTSQICEFGNWIPEELTGCLWDLEEVSGLTMTFGLSQAYFEGKRGGFYWVLFLWLCFHISSTEKPQSWGRLPVPAFAAVWCTGDTSHELCPLLCTYLWGRKVTPRCQVRDTAQPARLAREEPQMSLRSFPKGLIFVCLFSSLYEFKIQNCSC